MSATFNKPAHIRYHLRCLKTFLPTAYTSNDAQRMTLAFFTLCSLDLLNALDSNVTQAERIGYIEWIYKCQHPDGGFRGFTGSDLGASRNEVNRYWDPANIAATYFALASLAILGDDLAGVNKEKCLTWLKRLQLRDGTFGEALALGGEVQGGRDMRFCYCAAAIRWILDGANLGEMDIDVEGMMRFFEASQTYEGGFANGPFFEAHAGWTSCAVSAISLLGRLPSRTQMEQNRRAWPSVQSVDRLVGWLVSRQTSVLQEEDSSISTEAEIGAPVDDDQKQPAIPPGSAAVVSRVGKLRDESDIEPSPDDLRFAGFSGRCNKPADTCYVYWAGGSLAILDGLHLVDRPALSAYLLTKTQHRIGGFGKLPGDPPDIMHSCLGLAGLACIRHPDLKPFDPSLCISMEARDRLENLPYRRSDSRKGKDDRV